MNPTLTIEPDPATVAEPLARRPRRLRPLLARVLGRVGSALEWLAGAATLAVGLSALAAVPVAQFLSLGYLLEASGRVARTGRLRDGWIGVRRAARVGGMVAGAWLTLLPARLASSLATSAELIDPDGPVSRAWRFILAAAFALTMLHVATSCARGGRLRHFAWPPGGMIWLARGLRRGGLYVGARDATWTFVGSLRLPHYFRLGLLGFAGSAAWLALPIALMAAGRWRPVFGLVGGAVLAAVASILPFLQAQFAVDGRFASLFGARAARERFRRAPWAFGLALLLTVAAAIPLYLLKIELVPRDAAWLPGLLFVVFLFPARLACGWAYARGGRRIGRRHWCWRGLGRAAMLPVSLVYALIVFLAQYTSWMGTWSLIEQHAFLLPAPFLGY